MPAWPARRTPRTGMPSNVLVLPEAVEAGLKLQGNFETGALPTLTAPGELGPAYRAFDPSGGDQLKKNLNMTLPPQRFEDRRRLLAELDGLRRQMDRTGVMEGMDRFQQQAFDVIARGVGEAFDLSKEDPQDHRQVRHQQAVQARGHHEMVRHAAFHQPAGQADAAGPAAVRGGLRLRHRLRLRLGHARQRQQPQEAWPTFLP